MLSVADAQASTALHLYVAHQLPSMRKRAASWIPALTAITGVVSTALVVKGAATFTDLTGGPFWTVLICGIVFVVGMGGAIYLAYSAAYGEDTHTDELAAQQTAGAVEQGSLASALVDAVGKDVRVIKKDLRYAVIATVVATAALFVGSFTAAATPKSAASELCAKNQTTTVTTASSVKPGVSAMSTSMTTCS